MNNPCCLRQKIRVEAKQEIHQEPGRKIWRIRFLEELRHWKAIVCEPGNLGGHVHTQGRLCAQKRPEKTLQFHLWLIFRLRARRKWRRRQSHKRPGQAPKESICKDWESSIFSLGSRNSRSMLKHHKLKEHFRDHTQQRIQSLRK